MCILSNISCVYSSTYHRSWSWLRHLWWTLIFSWLPWGCSPTCLRQTSAITCWGTPSHSSSPCSLWVAKLYRLVPQVNFRAGRIVQWSGCLTPCVWSPQCLQSSCSHWARSLTPTCSYITKCVCIHCKSLWIEFFNYIYNLLGLHVQSPNPSPA